MLRYPVRFTNHPEGIVITFPGLPGVETSAQTPMEAYSAAVEALFAGLKPYFDARMPIPDQPEPGPEDQLVELSLALSLKVLLLNAMAVRGVTVEDLAHRMLWTTTKAERRLLECDNHADAADFERAFMALDCQLTIQVTLRPS
jgi:predicted RNase H-like HicB family nuclease